jgi:hypothetical protein
VDQEEVHGYCSAFVLNEVIHKLMMSEIVDKFGVQAASSIPCFFRKGAIRPNPPDTAIARLYN